MSKTGRWLKFGGIARYVLQTADNQHLRILICMRDTSTASEYVRHMFDAENLPGYMLVKLRLRTCNWPAA